MNRRETLVTLAGYGLAGTPVSTSAQAQEDPECCPGKCCPAALVVPFAPGGAVDIVARILAAELSVRWSQPVMVENVGGAGGLIGTEKVAKSTPNGKVLLVTNDSLPVAALLRPGQSPNFADALIPVTQLTASPYVLLVPANSPYKTVGDLVSAIRSGGAGQPTFAHAGSGSNSHLATELFGSAANVQVVSIPYRGSGPALADLQAGKVNAAFTDAASAASAVDAGRARALAVTSRERYGPLANVPTMAESGFRAAETINWVGLFAPRGLARATVERVGREAAQAISAPGPSFKLRERGLAVSTLPPAAFASFIATDTQARAAVIRARNIRTE